MSAAWPHGADRGGQGAICRTTRAKIRRAAHLARCAARSILLKILLSQGTEQNSALIGITLGIDHVGRGCYSNGKVRIVINEFVIQTIYRIHRLFGLKRRDCGFIKGI